MTTTAGSAWRVAGAALVLLAISPPALAQRGLHWQEIDVQAHLAASGELRVIETQTMVFNGAWNGGERRFTIPRRQQLRFEGLYRADPGGWRKLAEDSRLDDVDDYAWPVAGTLRWRSRAFTDPPFSNTVLRYQLRYVLSPVVLKEGRGYRINHDFAFARRSGPIQRFVLRFTHDAVWQPTRADGNGLYTAGPLPPGRSFVLDLPLRYTGATVPATLDLSPPGEIKLAVSAILLFTALAVAWFFIKEQAHGRFAPLASEEVDEAWLQENILKHPAEVVGAAWDGSIGTPEVVALIARMVSEGKLESTVEGEGKGGSMTLRLKVDRATLEGHEGTLVSWLFFDGSTETSTERVKRNYAEQGFSPANELRPELEARVQALISEGRKPRGFRIETVLLFVVGLGALGVAWVRGAVPDTEAVWFGVGAVVLAAAGWIAGMTFRGEVQWGRRAALICLLPALTLASATAAILWFYPPATEVSAEALVGLVGIALALTNASINGLRSRQSREGIALRKTLTAGRQFFIAQLQQDRPALRDAWYPWLLAFGLARAMDDWSAERAREEHRDNSRPSREPSSNAAAPEQQPWSGFGGGRSGGAGASGSWVAAADGIAAGVAVPKSSGASDRSSDDRGSGSASSSSDSGGSSSSASSGGGGGGGW